MCQSNTGRGGIKWKFRSIGSRSILLLLTWEFIICCSLGFNIHYFHLSSEKEESDLIWLKKGEALIGIAALPTILLPIVSLLAQVLIGRYKLISHLLKTLWVFSIAASIISVVCVGVPNTILFTVQLLLVLIPYYWLTGAFGASVVSLGMDQITGGTHANVSAFIQWLNWAFYSGFAVSSIVASVSYNCTHFHASEVRMILLLLSVLLLSVGLILDFCFHHKLVKEPVTVNPVSLIFKVLKYAAKHKYPVQRSAFTYCENEQPTRLDYGKSKYGGPFTTEQVEDVKTFWRVLLVILMLSLFALPLNLLEVHSALEKFLSASSCIQTLQHAILAPFSMILYSVPLYELLIYPCLRNRGPSILQSAGIGATALIASSLYATLADINTNNHCMITQMGHNSTTVGLIDIPINLLLGISAIVLSKTSIEFVCAQAPFNMNSLLIGLYITLQTIFFTIGAVVYEVYWFNGMDTNICGIWFYLTTLVLAVVSSALLGLVIRWYKARERDEITRSQTLVEEVYQKYEEQARYSR